jgi:hypothetical protein
VLSPPTASEPVKPVQQASNEVIKTVSTSRPKTDFDQIAFLDDKDDKSSGGGGSGSGNAANATTPDDKTDTKEAATNDKTGTKNEPVKKMYCN